MSSALEDEIDLKAFLRDSATETSGIFRYQPGDSFLHRIHPVTKLILSVGLVLIAFLMPSFHIPLVLTVVAFGVATLAGVHRSIIPVVLGIGVPLAVSVLLIHGMFYPGNETQMYTINSVPVIGAIIFWEEGISFALLILFRVLVLMIALLATILSTHPRELTIGLMEKGMPRKLSYVFMAALQFVPDMRDRANAIMEAQQARGLDTEANLLRRIKAFIALMAPLLIGTLIATETRALALESRGFAKTGKATHLFEVEETALDRVLQAGMVIAVIAVAVWAVVL
ncbi:MAG: energy-coupling factor transporter transmembrane protein EcfT [Halobacteriales archaeon]